jgi:hypothetical protein
MRTPELPALALASVLALGAGLGAAGCSDPAPRTSLDNLTVKGENLSAANRHYTEGNRLYMQGGVGVAEAQRKKNLARAIDHYQAAQAVYRKALRRHPDDISLRNRVMEVDMSIDGCRRMVNMNITGGDLTK